MNTEKGEVTVDTAMTLMVLSDSLADKAMERDREREKWRVAREERQVRRAQARNDWFRRVRLFDVLRFAAAQWLIATAALLWWGMAAFVLVLGVFMIAACVIWTDNDTHSGKRRY